MISVDYIPLSIRVRFWNLSLFSNTDFEDLLNEDLQTVINKVAKKEKNFFLNNEDPKNFLKSLPLVQIAYINTASAILSGAAKNFVQELLYNFEIENLKIVGRMLLSRKYDTFLYPDINYIGASLSFKKLKDVRTFEELHTILVGTCYESLLPALEKSQDEKNLLYWELALENYYISRLHRVSRRLDIKSRDAIKRNILFSIQYHRIIFLYRYRFHYDIDPREVLSYLPNILNVMSDEKWTKLVFMTSSAEFLACLKEWNYLAEDVEDNASSIRMHFMKKTEKLCRREIHNDLGSIASFIAFIQLKRIQFQKITTIIESKSLQVSKLDVAQFL